MIDNTDAVRTRNFIYTVIGTKTPIVHAVIKYFKQHQELIIVSCLILLGIVARSWDWLHVPYSENQDEISANYEAWSLLTQGTDRWGYKFPIYFLSWGSGQNVLYSYLSIPFVALFGVNLFTTRIVALLLGIATLPLFYFLIKRWFNKEIAYIALGLLATSVWHISISQFGLESNIAPFFAILGMLLLDKAIHEPSRFKILIALIPFALCLYAYGLALFFVAIYLLFTLITQYKKIVPYWKQWILSVIIFITLSLPFIIFLIDNYVLHRLIGFEKYLPFTIMPLDENRLTQLRSGINITDNNFLTLSRFFSHDIDTKGVYGSVQYPVTIIVLILAVIGLGAIVRKLIIQKWTYAKTVLTHPLLGWFLPCIPLYYTTTYTQSHTVTFTSL